MPLDPKTLIPDVKDALGHLQLALARDVSAGAQVALCRVHETLIFLGAALGDAELLAVVMGWPLEDAEARALSDRLRPHPANAHASGCNCAGCERVREARGRLAVTDDGGEALRRALQRQGRPVYAYRGGYVVLDPERDNPASRSAVCRAVDRGGGAWRLAHTLVLDRQELVEVAGERCYA